uniref:TDP-N-acetylfucosamine:lipid II N-acetylfucosaminyltransferase n=1 Tax=Amphritea sp. TaxID=1872502 RepID=UPI003A93BF17
MILHVCNVDRFIPPFIILVNEEFDTEDHQFWLAGTQKLKQHPIEKTDNVFIAGPTIAGQLIAYFKLFLMLHRARKLILHGLFNPRVSVLLALCPWLLKKCYWVIWGGDLYQYQKPKPRVKDKVIERLRKFVIKRIGHLITYIPGDVELARKWYGARGEYHECLMYLSNVVNLQVLQDAERAHEEHSGLNILVGNSADPSNNHLESLENLLPCRDHDIRVYVPLSYGDQAHANKVIKQGKAWFGDKFFPLASLMPFDQYLNFLNSIDIAIFNHKR